MARRLSSPGMGQEDTLSPPEERAESDTRNSAPQNSRQLDASDYLDNIKGANFEQQRYNLNNWDTKRRANRQGVEAQKAY